MGDSQPQKEAIIYGSAGMAASGMLKKAILAKSAAPLSSEQKPAAKAPESEPELDDSIEDPTVTSLSASPKPIDPVIAPDDDASDALPETELEESAQTDEELTTEPAISDAGEEPIPSSASDEVEEIASEATAPDGAVTIDFPFARTLKEADEELARLSEQAEPTRFRLPTRESKILASFRTNLGSHIGHLMEIHAHGSQGEDEFPAGGADLIANGPVLFDLISWVAGPVAYVTATLTEGGLPVLADEATEPIETLGPIVGDTVRAQIQLASGIHATFTSDASLASLLHGPRLEFVGTEGRARYRLSQPNRLLVLKQDSEAHETVEVWEPAWVEEEPTGEEQGVEFVDAIAAMEVAHAIFQAGLSTKRAYLPLSNRQHPISSLL